MIKSLADVDAKSVLIVEVRGPVDDVLGALKALEGVTQVTVDSRGAGSAVFAVYTRENRDLRDKIAALVIEKGWALLQLGFRRRTLEDAFFEVLREHNPLKDAIESRTGGSSAIQDKSSHAVAAK